MNAMTRTLETSGHSGAIYVVILFIDDDDDDDDDCLIFLWKAYSMVEEDIFYSDCNHV